MPKIVEFNAPENLGLRPTEVGVTATAAAARRVGSEYSEAAAAKEQLGRRAASAFTEAAELGRQYLFHQEVNRGAPAFANMTLAKDKQWDAYKKANAGNPAAQQTFLTEVLEPDLQKFRNGFLTTEGQRWAEARIDEYREHMYKKTTADTSKAEGDMFAVQLSQTRNGYANSSRDDPSETNLVKNVEQLRASYKSMGSPGRPVTADVTEEAVGDVVKSAILGHMQANDGQYPDWAKKKEWSKYVNPDDRKQFDAAGRTFANFADKQAKLELANKEKAAKDELKGVLNTLRKESAPLNPDDPPRVPPNGYKRLQDAYELAGSQLDGGKSVNEVKKEFDAITARLNKPPPAQEVSRQNWARLNAQITATDGTRLTSLQPIHDAYGAGLITPHDYAMLKDTFANMTTPDGLRLTEVADAHFKGIKQRIDQSQMPLGKMDPDGAANYARYKYDVENLIQKYREQGKNPFDLFNSNKPDDYVGSDKFIQDGGYTKTLQQRTRDVSQRMLGTPARTPEPTAPPPAAAPAQPVRPSAIVYPPAPGLKPQEHNLLEYHRDNLRRGTFMTGEGGDISTVYITGVTGPGGRIYNVPGYWDGQIHTDDAEIKKHVEDTGGWKKWPSYGTPEQANEAAQKLHAIIESDTQLFRQGGAARPAPAPATSPTTPSAPVGTPLPPSSPSNPQMRPGETPDEFFARTRPKRPTAPPPGGI